ncbi:hypothetical protein GXP67_32925 [Rhodocytophaga rosea]|uniref:Uncharacterized protein n=1 Tax=Rhodocytophaga rosea TaxID=2704465 RepID=A0A6C0GSM9_9BACT|nr:hypothetical protein [Rhodocytophaga rosea]QHT71119.1 hypothetical protein GXP67_32925 [Rhodocytophaga rosea]
MASHSEEQQLRAKRDAIERKVDLRKRVCFVDGCGKYAINSHILQKNGIINSISENNHVYQLLADNFKEHYYCFKKKGINEAYTFKGFCGSDDHNHDSELFKNIEQNSINLNDYYSQLLFSYRSLVYKLREREITKEIALEWYMNPELSIRMDRAMGRNWYTVESANIEMSIKDALVAKETVENEIHQNSTGQGYFQFHKRVIPRIEICCSQCFNYELANETTIAQVMGYESLTIIFFNIIPYQDQTVLLIGYPKDKASICGKYFDSMLTMSEKDLKKRISDLLLLFGDDWLCSPRIYLNYLRQ